MEGTKAKCGIRLRNEALFRTLLLGNLGSFPLLKGMRQKCLQEISLQRVKIIYEATAHPACRHHYRQACIERKVALDRQFHERDQVELNDAETAIVRRLCEALRYALQEDDTVTLEPPIPLDRQKRVYSCAEVLKAPSKFA